ARGRDSCPPGAAGRRVDRDRVPAREEPDLMSGTATNATILIVEDEPKLAQLLADYLAAASFATRRVADGREVVPLVQATPPDLILLDLMLPGKDGVTICRELRAFTDVPIVMVTARVDEIDRLLGLELGADDYICKPFSPREV